MSKTIADLYAQVRLDSWRNEVGFSYEIEEFNNILFESIKDEGRVMAILAEWLQKYQPCLFGRIAAKANLLSFCILTENDLCSDDSHIQNKIQSARTKWTKEGFRGEKSGFIVAAISPKITNSIPNQILMSLSKEICSNYLLEETIEEDEIYTDEIWLETVGYDQNTWKWKAGVNYFCANADKRWWQDHRIPGGLAFSVNSVGHMAKACGTAKFMNQLNESLGLESGAYIDSKVDSLEQALEFAMRTIDKASDAVSGKATELIPAKTQSCPIQLPKNLAGKDCRQYHGYYHTDITIPSEYFLSEIQRPAQCEVKELDFSYLYDENTKNVDHITMGKGRQIRKSSEQKDHNTNPKTFKTFPTEEPIVPGSRLHKALNSNL